MLQTILKIIRKNVFPPSKVCQKESVSFSFSRALSLSHNLCVHVHTQITLPYMVRHTSKVGFEFVIRPAVHQDGRQHDTRV